MVPFLLRFLLWKWAIHKKRIEKKLLQRFPSEIGILVSEMCRKTKDFVTSEMFMEVVMLSLLILLHSAV